MTPMKDLKRNVEDLRIAFPHKIAKLEKRKPLGVLVFKTPKGSHYLLIHGDCTEFHKCQQLYVRVESMLKGVFKQSQTILLPIWGFRSIDSNARADVLPRSGTAANVLPMHGNHPFSAACLAP